MHFQASIKLSNCGKMNIYILSISFFINIHCSKGYEYFRTIKPPDASNSWAYHQRLNRMPTAILSTSNENLSDDFTEPRYVGNCESYSFDDNY